jgi:hypothetical protein
MRQQPPPLTTLQARLLPHQRIQRLFSARSGKQRCWWSLRALRSSSRSRSNARRHRLLLQLQARALAQQAHQAQRSQRLMLRLIKSDAGMHPGLTMVCAHARARCVQLWLMHCVLGR